MQANGKGILSAILVTGLTIAVLFAGQYTWHKTQIEQPLTLGFKQLGFVQDWDIQYDATKPQVRVTLKGKADLQETYLSLTALLDKTMGTGNYNLVLNNTSNRKLINFYQKIQPLIYESISTGHFTWLVSELNGLAQQEGLEAKVQLDNHLLYLQVAEQDQVMYKLLPRESREQQGLATETTGISN